MPDKPDNIASPEVTNESVVLRLKEARDKLQRRAEALSFHWLYCLLCCILGAGYGIGIAHQYLTPLLWQLALVPYVAGGFVIGGLLYLAFISYLRFLLTKLVESQTRLLTGVRIDNLQETLKEDFFTKLVEINFKYIDRYYQQTQSQADKSFTLCAWVAVIGLMIIIAGIMFMYLGKTTPAYVTSATGVISEFIAAVFFYLYNRTILKMSQYHQKLVITQNVSIALKIAEGLPEAGQSEGSTRVDQSLDGKC